MDTIEDIIKNVIHSILDQNTEQSRQIQKSWNELITEKEREHTNLDGIKAGHLSVIVENTTWLYHMKTRKDHLLKEIQKQHPDVQQIRLKVGKI